MIKIIGEIREGLVNETIEGCVRLYDADQYPVIELYGIPGLDDNQLAVLATELKNLWNGRVKS